MVISPIKCIIKITLISSAFVKITIARISTTKANDVSKRTKIVIVPQNREKSDKYRENKV